MAFSVGLRPTSPLSSVARRGAPWPWKVWRFAPARSVFCSPFSGAALPPLLPLLHLLHLLNLLLRRLLARRRRACGCRGDWRLGSLEAWRLGFLCTLLHPAPACRALRGRGRFGASCLHAPFSVAVEGLRLRRCTLRSPGRPCRPSPFPKAWRAKPAMPYRPPGRTCALRARTARPASPSLCVLCDFQNNLAVLVGLSLCFSVFLCVSLCNPL